MPVEGAVAERVQGLLPITWDALSKDPRYGDGLLRDTIDTVKQYVTGAVVAPATEANYPLIVIDYLAKLVAIELVPPGIDFWMNQSETIVTTGTNETETFTDRAEKLRQQREEWLKETRAKAAEMAILIGYSRQNYASRPALNTMDDEFITPSHQEFPRPFAQTERS